MWVRLKKVTKEHFKEYDYVFISINREDVQIGNISSIEDSPRVTFRRTSVSADEDKDGMFEIYVMKVEMPEIETHELQKQEQCGQFLLLENDE